MTKWYEVKVVSVKVFAVEVADDEGEDEAMDAARDEIWGGVDEISCSAEIADPVSIDRIKRHADEVLDLTVEG